MKVWCGVHDAASARLAQDLSFDGLWLSSFGLSVGQLGLPDAGFLPPTFVHGVIQRMSAVSTLPIVVDGENGYQIPTDELTRVAEGFFAAGAKGICIEDTVGPKRNSLWTGQPRALSDVRAFQDVIRAIRDVASASGATMIARTEALIEGRSVSDVVARVHSYASAGADGIVVHFRDDVLPVLEVGDRCRNLCTLIVIPTNAPDTSFDEFEHHGYSVLVAANVAIRAAVLSMREALEQVLRDRRLQGAYDKCATIDDLDRLVDKDSILQAIPRHE